MKDVTCSYRYWLAGARQRIHMTQDEVAHACGISRSAYQKYEYGQRTPGKLARRKLSLVLLVPEERFTQRRKKLCSK